MKKQMWFIPDMNMPNRAQEIPPPMTNGIGNSTAHIWHRAQPRPPPRQTSSPAPYHLEHIHMQHPIRPINRVMPRISNEQGFRTRPTMLDEILAIGRRLAELTTTQTTIVNEMNTLRESSLRLAQQYFDSQFPRNENHYDEPVDSISPTHSNHSRASSFVQR